MRASHTGLLLLGAVQAIAAVRVLRRLTAGPVGWPLAAGASADEVTVSVVVPVLNELRRLGPCLDGLLAQDGTVREILVVDGGSTDGTEALVLAAAGRDPRVRLIDASPVPNDWNGKAWGLEVGREAATPGTRWLLTIDADVRPQAGLVAALASRAMADGVRTASVATMQEVHGWALGLLHPACLTTLVYRLGRPGRIARQPGEVQANGQCQLFDFASLASVGGFGGVRASRCEDVTIARALVAAGHRAGFYESDGLVSVRMYDRWQDAWNGWTRSLPLRDEHVRWRSIAGLADVTLAQALPLPILIVTAVASWPGREQLHTRRWSGFGRAILAERAASTPALVVVALNVLLLLVRLGVLAGIRRAYDGPPWTFWLAPLADFPVAIRLWTSILKRRHTWRGRPLVTGVQS